MIPIIDIYEEWKIVMEKFKDMDDIQHGSSKPWLGIRSKNIYKLGPGGCLAWVLDQMELGKFEWVEHPLLQQEGVETCLCNNGNRYRSIEIMKGSGVKRHVLLSFRYTKMKIRETLASLENDPNDVLDLFGYNKSYQILENYLK